MDRCLDCNATLKKEETRCWACGSAVPQKQNGVNPALRFAGIIKYLFFASAALTVGSLFLSILPFSKCLVATVVLLFVKSSADQMLEKSKG